ncbi:MAG: hypothetical protein C4576_32160 [Desulfobacteraceae bacterium]|nr:MAG: hypothetical protein C4576_32160 [Desulfobacteraceae bacterium]
MFDHEYVGNLHVHSLYSDGAATIKEIAACASGAGLDFVCVNDHSHMSTDLHLNEEGYSGNVLVLVGSEIGIRSHHYLAFGLKRPVIEDEQSPQHVIDAVNEQSALGFIAHPFEKGMPFLEKSTVYTWNDLSVKGFTGICIWNFTSRWKERVRTVFHGLFCLAFKTKTLRGPSGETLAYWDRLCLERKVVGIGGSDAHGSYVKLGPVRVIPFTYDFLLRTVNVHIFLNRKMPREFDAAKEQVYGALKAGRLFIAHDGLSPAKGFRFDYISEEGSELFVGEEGSFVRGGTMVIEIPRWGEMRLIRNGLRIKTWRGKEAVYTVTESGVYRVEVYLRVRFFGWRPWIFSNPIYLR